MRHSLATRACALCFVCALCLACGAALAEPDKQPPDRAEAEELRVVVARRLRSVTGTDARIRDLRYELLSSTFAGKGIELGPRDRPYVRLPHVTVELALLSSSSSLTVAKLRARGVRLAVPAAWISRPFPFLPHRPLTVRAGEVTHGELAFLGDQPATLRDLIIKLTDVELIPADGGPRLKGTLTLTAGKLELGSEVVLEELRLEGKLAGERLVVARLSACWPRRASGTASRTRVPTFLLSGSIGLKGAKLGAVSLKGKVTALPLGASGGEVHGRVEIKGKTIAALTVDAKLRGKGAPGSGALEGAPPFKLKGSIGGRPVTGTLEKWQLR